MSMILERCPHCGRDNEFQWNANTMGFIAHCVFCGKTLLLCDECIHADDGLNAECRGCNWHEMQKGVSCCFRYKKPDMMTFNVGFTVDDKTDETQFDIAASDNVDAMMTELIRLFNDFCADNHFTNSKIEYIAENQED